MTDKGGYNHFNPVNVDDTVGVIFLGTLAIILLVALLRSQARNRALVAQLSQLCSTLQQE